jgi:hypothetical protein
MLSVKRISFGDQMIGFGNLMEQFGDWKIKYFW